MISYPKATVAFDFIIHVFRKKHQTNLKMEDIVVEVCGENRNNVQNKTPFVEFSQKVTLRFEEKNPWRRFSSWGSFVHVFPFRLAGSHNENLHRILWNTIKDLVMENKF